MAILYAWHGFRDTLGLGRTLFYRLELYCLPSSSLSEGGRPYVGIRLAILYAWPWFTDSLGMGRTLPYSSELYNLPSRASGVDATSDGGQMPTEREGYARQSCKLGPV